MKRNEAIKQALDIIDLEEFDLFIVESEALEGKVFKLKDTTEVNLGDIESEEFLDLSGVLGRLEIYHNDYIYGEEDGENHCLKEKTFLESDEAWDLLSDVTPEVYETYMQEG